MSVDRLRILLTKRLPDTVSRMRLCADFTRTRFRHSGFSAIEDFVDSAYHLHSLIWWDKAAQRFKTAGCDDLGDQGCQRRTGKADGKAMT
jgi:hypothetical protein